MKVIWSPETLAMLQKAVDDAGISVDEAVMRIEYQVDKTCTTCAKSLGTGKICLTMESGECYFNYSGWRPKK